MELLKKIRPSAIVMLVLFLVAFCFALIFYLGNVQPGTAGTPVEEPLITDEFLILTYVYFGAALFLTLIFSISAFLGNPRAARNMLIGAVIFIAIFGLSYLISTGVVIPGFSNQSNVAPTIRWVDAGLKAVYFFGGLAVIGVIYTEISGMMKSN